MRNIHSILNSFTYSYNIRYKQVEADMTLSDRRHPLLHRASVSMKKNPTDRNILPHNNPNNNYCSNHRNLHNDLEDKGV
jgi:hypothetical protein